MTGSDGETFGRNNIVAGFDEDIASYLLDRFGSGIQSGVSIFRTTELPVEAARHAFGIFGQFDDGASPLTALQWRSQDPIAIMTVWCPDGSATADERRALEKADIHVVDHAPTREEVAAEIENAFRVTFSVVLRPHLLNAATGARHIG